MTPPLLVREKLQEADGSLWFCQDRGPGQGLVRWVRPQKISTSRQGPQDGRHGSWDG